jgi:hypothetical protein
MTPFIQRQRGISTPPLEVSALLQGPEAAKMKAEGKLVTMITISYHPIHTVSHTSNVVIMNGM